MHRARWTELDVVTAHDLLRLRVDVFVVEQRCPYPEIDGRDIAATTEHRWVAVDRVCADRVAADRSGPGDLTILACLRVLDVGSPVVRIGRVCARQDARGTGVARALMGTTVADHGHATLVLDAQRPLAGWYAAFGFQSAGPVFVEDGIEHVPMRRAPHSEPQGNAATNVGRSTRGPV